MAWFQVLNNKITGGAGFVLDHVLWVYMYSKCMVWGCSCPSVVVVSNFVLLYLVCHCIQTDIKSPFVHKLFSRFPMAK